MNTRIGSIVLGCLLYGQALFGLAAVAAVAARHLELNTPDAQILAAAEAVDLPSVLR